MFKKIEMLFFIIIDVTQTKIKCFKNSKTKMNSQQQINTKKVIDKIKNLGLVNICQEQHLSLMVPPPSSVDSEMRPD